MTLERQAALDALARLVGARHALTDPALIEGRLIEPRGLYRGKALALVRPGSTEEVAKVLAFCNDAGVGVVPQGGNTGLVGGQTPDEIRRSDHPLDRAPEGRSARSTRMRT